MPDPSPQIRILLEQLLSQNQRKLVHTKTTVVAEHRVNVDKYLDRQKAVEHRVDRARAAVDRATARIGHIEDELRQDALARYMSPVAPGLQYLVDEDDSAARKRSVLADVTVGVHLRQRRDAIAYRETLKQRYAHQRHELKRARDATKRARSRAAEAEHKIEVAQAKAAAEQKLLDIAQQRADAEQSAARAAVLDRPAGGWSLPIAGQSVFTAKELAEWFEQRGVRSRASVPITDLARYYVQEGNDQNIRGDMAFAQSVLETGSFTNQDTIRLNNFAGIGHCDTCSSGFSFPTAHLGVRAQIQLLADYDQRGVKLVHPIVDPRLHGPSGCCQTWGELTHTWATAGNYGPKIMGIYRQMLWWLVVHRGMTPKVGPG